LKLLLLSIFLSMISYGTFCQDNLSKDFPVLNKTYQADSKRADYVIVIDQSGSMRDYWPNVKNGISALIGSLPDEDYVSILGFSSQCQALVVPRKLNQSSKNELISQISQLPNPTGQKTDLFEAIDKTLDEINRPNSNELKFLFFITDFINDPPSNTNWDNTNIHLLKEKYERIIGQTNRLLKLYALQLPLDINNGRDYDKFANIFHTLSSPIFLNQSTLIEWFERLKAEIEREKLRMIIENDIKNAIEIVSFNNSISLIEKNSHFNISIINKSLLPLSIDSIVIFSDEYGKIQSSGFNTLAISNEEVNLKIELNKEMLSQGGTFFQRNPITIKSFEIYTSTKEVTEFGKLNLSPTKIYFIDKQFSSSFLVGFNYWQVLMVVIIVLSLFYYLFYPCLKPVWLFGKKDLKISIYIDDKEVQLTKGEFTTNKSQIEINNDIILEEKDKQVGLRDLFEFRTKFIVLKPKCVFRKPKAGTYVSVDSNHRFRLFENTISGGELIHLGKELTSKPVDFTKGVRLESLVEGYQSHKLLILIKPKY